MNNKDITLAWNKCMESMHNRLVKQQFNTWIKPLVLKETNNDVLIVTVPNQFILNWVNKNFVDDIKRLLITEGLIGVQIQLCIENKTTVIKKVFNTKPKQQPKKNTHVVDNRRKLPKNNIKKEFTFDLFVEGKSNQLGKAAAKQVAENTGGAYNPFFIYGGVGLGKTHLMHAIGNHLLSEHPRKNIIYLHSERFVADMVKALQHNSMNEFKKYYRSADVLLIDDIQFFAKKERTQEEFFHTFNELLEGQKQVVLTCDKYPKEVSGLEERLKSRFGWGLTVAIEPPELETRVAILKIKSDNVGIILPDDVAFFIARRISSNVRELEGALTRVIAHSNLTGSKITVEFVKEALRDLLAMHDRLISIDNIQKNVADYYNIRVSDLHSKSRIRSLARPRQMAMALAKELTSHSLPEIGQAFGGRDHTTVLHACRKIAELKESDNRISDDFIKILRILTT